jgi:mitochondrial fission protein ELM1
VSNHTWSVESTQGGAPDLDLARALGRPVRAWVLTDGKMGDVAQCLGVAERLGLDPDQRIVAPRVPYVWLMPWGPIDPRDAPKRTGSPLAPPYPDLAIASGRRAVAYLRALHRASDRHTFTVFLKDPRTGTRAADLIWVPEHDRLRGENVLVTPTSPHRVSPDVLARLRATPPAGIAALPPPRIAVILGGPAGATSYQEADIERFSTRLSALTRTNPASFLVTPSRRTPTALAVAAERAISGHPALIWRGTGENPYLSFLALADAVVVTGDSANMVSEAMATGRPVLIFRPDRLSRKLATFLDSVERRGLARPFRGILESYETRPIDCTPLIAAEIRRRMIARARADQHGRMETGPGT